MAEIQSQVFPAQVKKRPISSLATIVADRIVTQSIAAATGLCADHKSAALFSFLFLFLLLLGLFCWPKCTGLILGPKKSDTSGLGNPLTSANAPAWTMKTSAAKEGSCCCCLWRRSTSPPSRPPLAKKKKRKSFYFQNNNFILFRVFLTRKDQCAGVEVIRSVKDLMPFKWPPDPDATFPSIAGHLKLEFDRFLPQIDHNFLDNGLRIVRGSSIVSSLKYLC